MKNNAAKEPEEAMQKLWVNVIISNRTPVNGIVIEFNAPKLVEGKIEVEIEETNVEMGIKF